MQYEIDQDIFPMLTITLTQNEEIYAQVGAMSWMDRNILMKTNLKGGVFKAIGRKMSGNSAFLVNFKAKADEAMLGITTHFVGSIVPIELENNSIIAQKNGFLCAQSGIKTAVAFTKKVSTGLFGGEGFVLQKISGTGLCFLEGSGRIIQRVLEKGEQLLVDTGSLLAFQISVKYEIEVVKGLSNMMFSGEGMFITKLTGPGVVLLQTLTAHGLAERISPYFNRKNKRN